MPCIAEQVQEQKARLTSLSVGSGQRIGEQGQSSVKQDAATRLEAVYEFVEQRQSPHACQIGEVQPFWRVSVPRAAVKRELLRVLGSDSASTAAGWQGTAPARSPRAVIGHSTCQP